MKTKFYKVTYKIGDRKMSKTFDCSMDAEEFYISKCRDFRCRDIEIKCVIDGVEKYMTLSMQEESSRRSAARAKLLGL